VWQTKDFKSNEFGSVANAGVTSGFFGCVAMKGFNRFRSAKAGRSEWRESEQHCGGLEEIDLLVDIADWRTALRERRSV
jgi:hypothetical protein